MTDEARLQEIVQRLTKYPTLHLNHSDAEWLVKQLAYCRENHYNDDRSGE